MHAGVRCHPARGFTLVELLIALAIVSLIALMLFSGLRLGARAWEGVDAVSERVSAMRGTRDFLLSSLSQARYVSLKQEERIVSSFTGLADRLELAAPLSEHVGMPGLYLLRFERVPNGESESLILTRWLVHPEVLEGGGDIPPWTSLDASSEYFSRATPVDLDLASGAFGQTLMIDHLDVFAITYFGLLDGDTEPDWHEEWVGQSGLPNLVRIELGTTAQSWPDLIVALPGRSF
ncbi:MAG: prepilin-type N-terminal cleavage/methylation domain-containing protein [Sphingobacteriia bacterium]|nr:prepilin-type N-terminal cleavage/methylation domain-containing protein [Sphingobacteriia bacterium]NCC38669.1 prepilin-type N-terminal cleavage/methylation domain-containing protein [Gammaproteobacteria bacterium]